MSCNLIILTGKIHAGKTTITTKIIKNLTKRGYRFNGFITRPLKKGKKIIGYNSVDLITGEKFRLLTTNGKRTWQKTGKYFFDPEGLKRTTKILKKANSSKYITVIDEIGPAEILYKKGLWKNVKKLLSQTNKLIFIVIRKDLLIKFILLVKRSIPRPVKMYIITK